MTFQTYEAEQIAGCRDILFLYTTPSHDYAGSSRKKSTNTLKISPILTGILTNLNICQYHWLTS